MDVGDLIKFTEAHSSRPGFGYCIGWTGLVYDKIEAFNPYRVAMMVYWVTDHGFVCGNIQAVDYRSYEVINESR